MPRSVLAQKHAETSVLSARPMSIQ